MNCSFCKTPNEEEAKFCKNCRAELVRTSTKCLYNFHFQDSLLFIYLTILVIATLAAYPLTILVETRGGKIIYVYVATQIIKSISLILVPLSIKNIVVKIIGLILASIIIISAVWSNIIVLSQYLK